MAEEAIREAEKAAASKGLDITYSVADLNTIELEPNAFDLVIIGQGDEIAPIPRDAQQALEAAGIGVEIMATPSACRTYNVLLTEDRRVAVVLVPVGTTAPSQT